MPVIIAIFFFAVLFFAGRFEKKFDSAALAVLFLLAALTAELFFNQNFFESLTYGDVQYTVTSTGTELATGGYSLSKSDKLTLEISSGTAKNLSFIVDNRNTELKIYASDEGSETSVLFGSRYVSSESARSRIVKLNLTGDASRITLTFPSAAVIVTDVELNVTCPFVFSPLRFAVFPFLLFFIYFIIMKKKLWESVCDFSSPIQHRVTIAVMAAVALIFLSVAVLNPSFLTSSWTHHKQYDLLAQSFMEGKLDIDYGGADILNELSNPYDTYARRSAFKEAGKTQPWDVSFFEGKFYVYFGVLPVFLFYIPSRLIFNAAFPNFLGVVIFSWVLIFAVFTLYKKITEKYFPRTPYLLYILLSVSTLFMSGTFNLLRRPDFYSIPVMGGIAFAVIGLCFWLFAEKDESGILSRGRLFAGSVFMALVLTLRPNLILFATAAVLIYWRSVFEHRELLSINSTLSGERGRGLKNTVAFCAPFVVVGVGVMAYNYCRFHSPFDFGAAYNLTTSDMTRRVFSLDRWGLGIFEYLFAPPSMHAAFPFIQSTASAADTLYVGFTSHEKMYGGLFAVCPMLLSYLAAYRTKKSPLFKLSVFMGLMSLAVVLLDIQAGGILPRYEGDFAVFFAIGAVLVLLSLREKHPNLTAKFTGTATLLILVYAFCLVFADGNDVIQSSNPRLFYGVYTAFNPFN